MNDNTRFLRKYLWKLKISLKIKIFMWFLSNKVLLTKDNLAKRAWIRCKICCFCDRDETVEFLFLSCPFARLIWWIIFFMYNIPPPTNITNNFGNWLSGIDKMTKARICFGVSALCRSIWTCRNDIIFNITKYTFFCMLFAWLRIVFSYGPIFPRRINRNIWLLATTNYWGLHMISTNWLLGGVPLVES
jgi:hypothetical protein